MNERRNVPLETGRWMVTVIDGGYWATRVPDHGLIYGASVAETVAAREAFDRLDARNGKLRIEWSLKPEELRDPLDPIKNMAGGDFE